jgi:hypothetical protein
MKRLLTLAILLGALFATVTAASARPYFYGGPVRGYGGAYYGANYGPRATYWRGGYGPAYGYGYYGGARYYAPRAYYRPYTAPVYGYRPGYAYGYRGYYY